jgi:hypothetical protein
MMNAVLPLLTALLVAAGPESLAVLPLRPLGVKADAAEAMESTLRDEISRLPEVSLTDPAKVARALQARPNCLASPACAAAAAKRAGAVKLVLGTVSSLGELYTLDLKLLEAKNGKEIRRLSRPVSGKRDLLLEAVRATAVELVAPERYVGSLLIGAIANDVPVPGAKLYLDGKLAGTTPLTAPITGLRPGQHALRVSKEGAKDADLFVDVQFDKVAVVRVDLVGGTLAGVAWVREEAARALLEGEQGGLLAVSQRTPRSPALKIAGLSAAGVGIVAAVIGVAFHARAYGTASDLNRREQENRLARSDLSLYGDIDREVKTARALYVAGAIFVAGGAAALLYDRYLDSKPRPVITPLATGSGAGILLSGAF